MGNLITLGDSFTEGQDNKTYSQLKKKVRGIYGEDITDRNAKNLEAKKLLWDLQIKWKSRAWPNLLSKMLDLNSINLGKGGNSNHIMTDNLSLIKGDITENDVVIIALTSPWRSLPKWCIHPDIASSKAYPDKFGKLVKNKFYNDFEDYLKSERGKRFDKWNDKLFYQVVFDKYMREIRDIQEMLKGKNYLITQAFSPVNVYFDKYYEFPKEVDNFIEWGKKNNTLIDMCCGSWLDETKSTIDYKFNPLWFGTENVVGLMKKVKSYFRLQDSEREKISNIHGCGHPNDKGHKIIAKTLLPYIQEKLKQ